MIAIIILSILVGLAVAVYLSVRRRAESATTRANYRSAEDMMNALWVRLMDNGADEYRDPDPPTGPVNLRPHGYFVANGCMYTNGQYMSCLETKTYFTNLNRVGGGSGGRWTVNGVYRAGVLKPGTGGNNSDWTNMYGTVGISWEYYWDSEAGEYRDNENDYSNPTREEYKQMMIVVLDWDGTAYYTSYTGGSIIGAGSFDWDNGRGHP
ncbi:MAG: hypothetical protein KKF41_03295 [Actinobacteria bacterium]|nr:hypothetical protein [Actinomycetota bacterium]MBU2686594.1 hypothetical protein [Actinomycetota bacterium]